MFTLQNEPWYIPVAAVNMSLISVLPEEWQFPSLHLPENTIVTIITIMFLLCRYLTSTLAFQSNKNVIVSSASIQMFSWPCVCNVCIQFFLYMYHIKTYHKDISQKPMFFKKICKYLISIYNLNPYVMNYAGPGGIWWMLVLVTDSSLLYPTTVEPPVCE